MPAITSNAQPVAELAPYGGYPFSQLRPVVLGGRWLLSAGSPYTNFPLWITDGTATGTVGLGYVTSTIYPLGRMIEAPRNLTVAGSLAYFAAVNGNDSEEPFVTDGTPAGTRYLGNLNSTPAPGFSPGSSPGQFTPLGTWTLFTATHNQKGRELWRTDGTPEGTLFLADIFPGRPSSEIATMTGHAGRVWFTARTPGLGRELWNTDGTAQGTLPVQDLLPGPGSADPRDLLAVGTNLLFIAIDGADEPSLHRLDPAAQPLTPYEQWLATFAPPPAFPAAPWLDGDGDGWSNEMEYLFDSDPVDPSARHPLRAVGHLVDNTLDYITLTYQRPSNWADLGLWFTYSAGYFITDLSVAAPSSQTITPNPGGLETVTLRFWVPPSPYNSRFVTLRIRRN